MRRNMNMDTTETKNLIHQGMTRGLKWENISPKVTLVCSSLKPLVDLPHSAYSLVNLKKDTQCMLCNDTLNEPKILPCFHTFCKPCVKRHAELIQEANVFKCPKCNSKTPLPNLNSVEDLKPSVLHTRMLKILEFIEEDKICSVSESHSTGTQYCFDCDRSLCDECLKHHAVFMNDHKVMSLTKSESTGNVIELLLCRENKCFSHLEKTLDFHCTDCGQSICLECWKQDHDGHLTISQEKYVSTKKSTLINHLEQLKLEEKQIQEQVKVIHEQASKIKDSCEKAKAEVKHTLERTIKELEQNGKEILSQIDKEIEDANTKEIKAQSTLEQARGAIDYADALKKAFTSEIIGEGLNMGILKSFNRVLKVHQGHSLVVFDPNKELARQVSLGVGSIRKVHQTKKHQVLLTLEEHDGGLYDIDRHFDAINNDGLLNEAIIETDDEDDRDYWDYRETRDDFDDFGGYSS